MFRSFTTRDFVFAAMMGAALIVSSMITVPIVLKLQIPGIRQMVYAPFASFFLLLGLARIQKMGTLTLISLISALVMLLISPVIFGFIMAAAIGAEIICVILFHGYRSLLSQATAAVLYNLISFPVGLWFGLRFMPERFQHYNETTVTIFLAVEAAILVLSLLGVLLGAWAVRELRKAGRFPSDVTDAS